ncbi:MAG: flavodoxin domain-containing protein [Suipraeoptans sp.]
MKIAVRYYTKSGNTKKVAETIASKLRVEAYDLSEEVSEDTDILFLGSSLYAFDIEASVKDYISKLDKGKIQTVALFGTSAITKSGNRKMEKLVLSKGIPVVPQYYHCKGEFKGINKGRPNENDLEDARKFADSVIEKLK